MGVRGLLLAAGAGRRMGLPKALVRAPDGAPWLTRAVDVLLDGGCPVVTVVLGAAGDEAAALLAERSADEVRVVHADAWQAGMAASLRAGLSALTDEEVDAALVHLVDLPDVTADVVKRVLGAAEPDRGALARAAYDGRPGHPVLLGSAHWRGVVDAASGDRGARLYLSVNDPLMVECGDLATGVDVDWPEPTADQRPDH